MRAEPKLITIALRDLALPVPRTGSIEAHSGYGRATLTGQEVHARVQRRNAKSDPTYEPEVPVGREFERDGFRFRIEGRMDGIYRHNPPSIEEIKTSFDISELASRLSTNPLQHPYCLQLLTYGYFSWLEQRVLPHLTFHLVSTRNGESLDLACPLDVFSYEQWLDLRLDELVAEVRKAEKRVLRRKKITVNFPFPFEAPRPGQAEIMQRIEQTMHEKNPMLIQAPTGLGKTVGVLYPIFREALSRGKSVVYVTPKNSQHSVVEDAVERFHASGSKIKALTITAKNKICFKNELLCSPDYCEYALDYYAKVHNEGILDMLAKKRKLKAHTFRNLGARYEICPFELQLDAAPDADIVICDYNYVFSPRSALGRVTSIDVDQGGKPDLVIDEAHNLPTRAMEYYSPSLSSITLEQMRYEIHSIPPRFRQEAEELLSDCIAAIVSCSPLERTSPTTIDTPAAPFREQDARLRAFLSRYLASDVDIQPRDVIMRLCFYWSEFTEALEYAADPGNREFFTTYHPHATGGVIKITCCDASALIRGCYKGYEQVIAFSATLKPFDYYARLSGLDPASVTRAEFSSPFAKENRKLLIIPQISTKYADRERNYGKIADVVHRIASQHRGNYFAFFSSFEFLNRVFSLFQPPEGFTVLRQEREMKAFQVDAILEHLHTAAIPTIIFAVQGGTFAEGVDYPGNMAIGAFVIGPPLPTYDIERERMREYYQRQYGAGFDYAYAIPAMAKAIQAAGRVIRSETDRGLIVLMDNRFVQPAYSHSMPADWFESDVAELVSSSILKDVSAFWERNGAAIRRSRS